MARIVYQDATNARINKKIYDSLASRYIEKDGVVRMPSGTLVAIKIIPQETEQMKVFRDGRG